METLCSDCFCLCFYSCVQAFGFGKIIILGADSWVGVSLVFVFNLWFLGLCGGCVLPSRELFQGLDGYGHWALWIKCGCRSWELTLRNGDGIAAGVRGSIGRRTCPIRICLIPSEWD